MWQLRNNVVELVGDAMVNGRSLSPQQTIQSGDSITTGPASSLVFVIGNAAFQVRQNSRFVVERGNTLNIVRVLRLLTGGIASVWGKGTARKIITPKLTAGIPSAGVYTEVFEKQNFRRYFCSCYGVVDFSAGNSKLVSRADYHQSFWSGPKDKVDALSMPAKAINHTDKELENLARLID